mmetsp:Transcript_17065/g.47261  ORF Transcript_17065/g.47261 Transcript_17065/m.47261 type:complete len:142 (-) Transcript_17065:292-717(-)
MTAATRTATVTAATDPPFFGMANAATTRSDKRVMDGMAGDWGGYLWRQEWRHPSDRMEVFVRPLHFLSHSDRWMRVCPCACIMDAADRMFTSRARMYSSVVLIHGNSSYSVELCSCLIPKRFAPSTRSIVTRTHGTARLFG